MEKIEIHPSATERDSYTNDKYTTLIVSIPKTSKALIHLQSKQNYFSQHPRIR